MSVTAILLVVSSAAMHAGWNFFSKSRHPSAAFLLVASLAGSLLLSPVLLMHWSVVVHHVPKPVFGLLVCTGFSMAIYYAALAGAYRSGAMSVAYPLARAAPVLFVLVFNLLLGRGRELTAVGIGGICLVVAGCFLIPLQSLRRIRLGDYWTWTCLLALVAAVGTAGYSLIDDAALRQLRAVPEFAGGTIWATLIYSCLEALSASLWLVLYIMVSATRRQRLAGVLRSSKLQAGLTGAAIHLTYATVLLALAYARNVSYVVAFRQLSIPIGAALGIALLGEKAHGPKIVGVLCVLAGLVLVALG